MIDPNNLTEQELNELFVDFYQKGYKFILLTEDKDGMVEEKELIVNENTVKSLVENYILDWIGVGKLLGRHDKNSVFLWNAIVEL